MPLGMDPKAIEKALAQQPTKNPNLFLKPQEGAMSTSYHVREAIRDCDNLHKLQEALIIAIDTAIWVHDDQSDNPYSEGIGGEMWEEIRKVLND